MSAPDNIFGDLRDWKIIEKFQGRLDSTDPISPQVQQQVEAAQQMIEARRVQVSSVDFFLPLQILGSCI